MKRTDVLRMLSDLNYYTLEQQLDKIEQDLRDAILETIIMDETTIVCVTIERVTEEDADANA